MPQLKNHIPDSYSNPIPSDSNLFLGQMANDKETVIWSPPFQNNHWISSKEDQYLPPLPFIGRDFSNSTILFTIFLLVLISWGYYYQKHPKGLRSIFNSFFKSSTFFSELNDRSGANGFVSLGMFLLGIINISIFSYQVISEAALPILLFDFQKTGFAVLILGFSLILILFLKTLYILSSGVIFNSLNTFQAYLSLLIISIQVEGVLLFPIIVLHTYAPSIDTSWVINMGLILMSFIYFYRLTRAFILGLKQTNAQVFHIILYICTLEILPLFVIGRIAFENEWL